jgi:polyisoprenoid-binding protein YceI
VSTLARFHIAPQRSELWAEARSSLHPVRVHTSGLVGVVEAELVDGQLRLGTPTYVEVETERLRSGNGLVDGELQRRLDSRKFPRIRGELVRSGPGTTAGTNLLTGELTLHGVTRSLDVEVTVRQLDPRTLEIEGSRSIDMRDFGLPPPSFLMFRMQPEVQVRAKLVAERKAT